MNALERSLRKPFAPKALCHTLLARELAIAEAKAADTLAGVLSDVWTIQGLGMLRMYIAGGKFRLHVWDSRYRVDGVTMLHDHPWDFDSEVIAGKVIQRRYVKSAYGRVHCMEQSIVCGEGGGVHEDASPVTLEGLPLETLNEGDRYTQAADEIHESTPQDGTVTLIERTFHENTEVAHVYYPADGEWVSAEPRPAHPDEVIDILSYSLETWF